MCEKNPGIFITIEKVLQCKKDMPNSQGSKLLIAVLAVFAFVGGSFYYYYAYSLNHQPAENTTQVVVTTTPGATVTPDAEITYEPAISNTPTSAPVIDTLVYFSKNPDSNNDFTFAVSVNRKTTRLDVGTFSLEQLISGPTNSEASLGLFTPLRLTGESSCGTKDFLLSIVEPKKAIVKLCKDIITAGIGDDARIKSTIEKTLKQFPTISSVAILTKTDDCFGDMSGQNLCK